MQLTKPWIKWAAAANVLAAACALYAADPAIISIASKNLFPESITSTADGAIIIGSYGTSTVWRIPPGENNAAKWIDASNTKGPLLGVLADEKSGRLLVCQAGVKTFDLKTGAAKEELTIPTANPFCNDLAVRNDGSLFITDTTGAKVFMFAKGTTTPFATTAVEVASDPLLAGADGLAFLSDPKQALRQHRHHQQTSPPRSRQGRQGHQDHRAQTVASAPRSRRNARHRRQAPDHRRRRRPHRHGRP